MHDLLEELNDTNTTYNLKPMDVSLAAVYFIIAVVGIIANMVVFFIIVAGKETTKTVTSMYVLQLTLTDSLFLFMLPFFAMYKLTNSWTFGLGLCKAARTFQTLNYTASVFFLTAMSIDRYIAVAYTTRARQVRTIKRTKIICVFVWIISILMTLPQILYTRTEVRDQDTILCDIAFPDESDVMNKIKILRDYDLQNYTSEENYEYQSGDYTNLTNTDDYYKDFLDQTLNGDFDLDGKSCQHAEMGETEKVWKIIKFIISFIIPFAVITISYLLILHKLRVSEEKMSQSTITSGGKSKIVRKRVTRMVAVLVVCFLVCWFPYSVLDMIRMKGTFLKYKTCDYLVQIFTAMAYANSAINPLLYTFLGHNFKQRLEESVKNFKRALPAFSAIKKVSGFSFMGCKRRSSVNSFGKTKQKINNDGEKVLLKNFKHQQQFQNANDYKIKRPDFNSYGCETEMTPVERYSETEKN